MTKHLNHRHSAMPTLNNDYVRRPCQLLSWLFVSVWLTVTVPLSLGFNLEPESVQVFAAPSLRPNVGGRESYFGFSVALQKNSGDSSPWLVVGAPRANSSMYLSERITEPGAIYKCDLKNSHFPCEELLIDRTGNGINEAGYQDLKNYGWLGAVMDSQPTYEDGRQVTGVCAPRWKNQYYVRQNLMNGVCYWLNASLPNEHAQKKLPLIDLSKQTTKIYGRNLFFYQLGQAGMSLHFPDNHKEMIIGAPGVFNWQGTVIHLVDNPDIPPIINSRGRQQTSQRSSSSMFSSQLVVNPFFTPNIRDFDLFGYAVSSGRFFDQDKLLYVSGAPRGSGMKGEVLIFEFPVYENAQIQVYHERKGNQLGENFGASLVSADVNGDGLSDLIVGSPTFSEPDKPDIGRIQVFSSKNMNDMVRLGSHSGSKKSHARFGTTLAYLGNLNQDRYEDIAVGAPFEDDGKGAVYIYLGTEFGLRTDFSQRLTPSDIQTSVDLRGFGMAISRGIDIDNNQYPDIAIGSFRSGNALVLRSRAVASLTGVVTFDPPALNLESTSFQIKACVTLDRTDDTGATDTLESISLDRGHPAGRASFADDGSATKNFSIQVSQGSPSCRQFLVNVQSTKINPRRPILVDFDYKLKETKGNLINEPITDSHEQRRMTIPLRIRTDCEDNGNNVCEIDMHVEANFVDYREGQRLVIGGEDNPVLEVIIRNTGESVFLPNVTVDVPKPFALFMPTSHSCDYVIKDSRSKLACQLISPIKKDFQDKVQFMIDMSLVTDTAIPLKVDVQVAGDGDEQVAKDNFWAEKLELIAKADLKLQGFSKEEQIHYSRFDEDTINTTSAAATFIHFYTLVKTGPTPLGQVEFTLDIPVNFTGGVNFISLHSPQTNFLNDPFSCNVEGISFAVDKSENGEDDSEVDIIDNANFPPSSREDEIKINLFPSSTKDDTTRQVDPAFHKIKTFACEDPRVSCAKLQCQINSWPRGTHSAEFSIKMEVNYMNLANYISARAGAIVKSTAKASIASISQDLEFVGEKTATATVDTYIIPLSLPMKGVRWWIILLAVLAGLLLLIILAVILYKCGFFRRKKQEEMKAHKAHLETNTNYGATTDTEDLNP